MERLIGNPVASFIDLLLDAICVVDAEGRFVFISAACERIFGYTQQEMIGKLMIDMVAPADRARTLAAAESVMQGEPHNHFENRYIRKDGSLVHIMWSARWSEADQRRVAVARDVTLLKQAEAMQTALYAMSEAAHASDDLADLFRRSHTIIRGLLQAPGLFVALPEGPAQQLQFAYQSDPEVHHAAPLALLCDEVFRNHAPLFLEAGDNPTLPASLRAAAAGMRGSALAVPLTTSEGSVGVLALASADGQARYTDADRTLLQFMANQLADAIERKRMHAQLRFIAMHDELTRLPNRRLFHDRLDAACARARRQHSRLAVLFIDLDRFKQVNDRFGHACGDRLLQQVASRVGATLRATDTLARLGGDEFVALLEDCESIADGERVMEKIHEALLPPFELGGGVRLTTSASIGIAHYPNEGDSVQALMFRADAAMYAAKARTSAHGVAPRQGVPVSLHQHDGA